MSSYSSESLSTVRFSLFDVSRESLGGAVVIGSLKHCDSLSTMCMCNKHESWTDPLPTEKSDKQQIDGHELLMNS